MHLYNLKCKEHCVDHKLHEYKKQLQISKQKQMNANTVGYRPWVHQHHPVLMQLHYPDDLFFF